MTELRCALCPDGKPFCRWRNYDDVLVWICLSDAARLGYPAAIKIQESVWLNSQLEKVISIETIQ